MTRSSAAAHQVDGLSGATITGNAVTALVTFWFGELGYGPFLRELAARPPAPTVLHKALGN